MATTSPSSQASSTGNLLKAAAICGQCEVQSLPLRVKMRASLCSIRVSARYPSYFNSHNHSSPLGADFTSVANCGRNWSGKGALCAMILEMVLLTDFAMLAVLLFTEDLAGFCLVGNSSTVDDLSTVAKSSTAFLTFFGLSFNTLSGRASV